ncbi:hypothetical protein SCHPADRAFT_91759 [Schizopora paradoxa]|uniref:Uncharacterized protein n=1 Tax=Schizopora paradoxa TaxID=27342 RepID=A0A0H2SBN6_9AGAM|nr:hypothetical protein SCHPADRAFT_91759 [Schizopora paradoxa]
MASKTSPRQLALSSSSTPPPSAGHSSQSSSTATPRAATSASAPVSPADLPSSSSARVIGRSVSTSAVGKPYPQPPRAAQLTQYTQYPNDTPASPASLSSNASSPFARPNAPFAGRRYVSSSSSSVGPRTGSRQTNDYHSSPSAYENAKSRYGATGGSSSSAHARGYKSSGSVSDGSMFIPTVPSDMGGKATGICMKRLMSKPARPSTPTSVSILSDPEVVDPPRRMIVSSPEPPSDSHRSLGRHRGAEWEKMLEGDLGREKERKGKGADEDVVHLRSQSSSFSLSSPSESPLAASGHRSNSSPVHTRPQIHLFTSTSGSGRVRRTSNVSPIALRGEVDINSPPSASYSPNTLSPSTVPTPSSRGSSANPYNSSPQNSYSPSSGRHLNKPAAISRRDDSPPPVGLTPAEIVAHTYKQQERRRAELARGAAMELEDQAKAKVLERAAQRGRASASDGAKQSRSAQDVKIVDAGDRAMHEDTGDVPMTPYYTVFGNPSGRVVNIGSERDSAFGLFESELEKRFKHTPPAVLAEISLSSSRASIGGASEKDKRDSGVTVKRKLSRKMSAKLRKDPPKMSAKDDSFAGGSLSHVETERKRRPSLNIHLGRRYVAVDAEMAQVLPSARNGTGTPVSSKGSSSHDGHVHIIRTPEPRPNKKDKAWGTAPPSKDEVSPGGNHSPGSGKLWRLVKKISSNALKDKFHKGANEDPPPVPSIPAEVLAPLPTRLTFEKEEPPARNLHKGEKHGELHFTPTRKPVPSQSRPTRPSTAPALDSKPFGQSTPASRNRPSTTTRSSSPLSSDISSSKYFNQVGSSRSSTSSYGEAVPQSKAQSLQTTHRKVDLGEHILSPEKLQMFEEFDFDVAAEYQKVQVASPQDSNDSHDFADEIRGRTRSSDDYLLSLPCPPPRRSPVNGYSLKRDASTDSSTDSSLMPTFNTENAVNTFGFRRNQQSLPDSNSSGPPPVANSSEPPPRPPRSARRTPAATTVFRHSSPPPPLSNEDSGEERTGRASIGALSQASTARPTHDVLDSRSEVPAPEADGTATFRDMKKGARTVLTERQKLDMWDDLLSKSEKAGGTLHVGTGGLLSDRIRDSQYSEC